MSSARRRSIFATAARWAATLPDERRDALRKHALATQREPRLHALLNLAKGEPEIRAEPKQFDADPWLLGCENVTMNLRTKKAHLPQREDYITKSTGLDPNMTTTCPAWFEFLDWAFPNDPGTIEHLQRVAGYVLTGDVAEEKLFACFGSGGNGKNTFVVTMMELLGDYADKGNKNLLFQSQGEKGAASPDVAKLHGKRLVVVSETDDGCFLAEAQVKEIVSNEPISARKLHSHPFTFLPTHKLVLMTNNRPFVKGTDEGIWRRLNIIEFKSEMPAGKKDLHFREKHIRPEHASILTWAIKGCFKWQREGLTPSKTIVEGTDAYRSEMDFIGQWLEERTITDPQANTLRKVAYSDYKSWATDENRPLFGNHKFGEELRKRDFPIGATKGDRTFKGLRMKPFNWKPQVVGGSAGGAA